VVERQLGGAAVSEGGDDNDDAGSVRTLGADTVATGVSGAPRKRKSKAQDAKEQQEKAAKIARQSRSVCCFGTCGKKLTASDKRENKICCPVHYKPWAIGYAYMTEEEAGTKYGDDPSFRKAFDGPSKYMVDNEIEVDRFSPKQVEDSSEQKASCQRILGCWTRPEIFNKLKYMPEQLGYKCFTLWGVFGTPTLGVLTSDLEGAPRTFTFEFSKMFLHDDSSQLDNGRGPSARFEADEFEKDADILSVGAEQATLQITGSLPDMIEQGRFPPERSAELKELVDITSQMSFPLPKRDFFSSYVARIQQENSIGSHVGTMITCLRAFPCDVERETRAADIKSLHAQVKAYNEFGAQSLPEDLSDSIDQFMVKVMIAMGSGEDMDMIQAVLDYIRLVCDLGLDLIALKGDLSEQMAQFKICLPELSNIQWDLAAVVGFKKHGATAEATWQSSKGKSELGQFVAASAAMTEASAKTKLDFFTRWRAQVKELALEVATFDCNYHAEDVLQACEKHISHSITTGVDEGLWHDGLNDATTLDQYLEKAKESIFKICRPSALKTAIDVVSVKLAAAKKSRDLHGDNDEGRHAVVEDIATKLGRAKVTQAECLMLACCRDFADAPLKLKRNINIHLSNLSSKESSLTPKSSMRIFEEKADVRRKTEPKQPICPP
ncbi:unnamed protein product, partial [Prorocentrum cordatum]